MVLLSFSSDFPSSQFTTQGGTWVDNDTFLFFLSGYNSAIQLAIHNPIEKETQDLYVYYHNNNEHTVASSSKEQNEVEQPCRSRYDNNNNSVGKTTKVCR